MKCNQIETFLLDYVSGKLAPADRAAAQQHLAVCPECRMRAEGFRMVSTVMDDWDTPEISPWFNARLRQRIAAEEALGWNWLRAWDWFKQPAAATAFAAILIVGSLAVWTARPSVQSNPSEGARIHVGHKDQVDELMPVVDDFDMLANFEVIQDLKGKTKTPVRDL